MIFLTEQCVKVANDEGLNVKEGTTEAFPIPDRKSHDWAMDHFKKCSNCKDKTARRLGCGHPIW